MKTIRVFEAFSGLGAQAMALKALGRDFPDKVHFEFVGTSEIEKYAIILYKAVHGDVPNFGDISKIDWGGKCLILTYLHIHGLVLKSVSQDDKRALKKGAAHRHRYYGSASE